MQLLGCCPTIDSVFRVITDIPISGNNRKSNNVFKTDPVSML